MNKLIILAVVFLGIVLSFCGCEKQPTETTIALEEINCKLTEEEKFQIMKIADYEFDFYHSIFKEKYPTLKVKIFGDSTEYREYQKKISKTKATNGFYSQSKKVCIINKNDHFMKTIFHELNHFIIHYYLILVPKWINEGLSEYFEYSTVEDSIVQINKQPKKAERLNRWTSERSKIDLADFFTWSSNRWEEENSSPDFYSSSLSWGLIYFFMEDELRREILIQIITAIRKGKNSTEAINEFYPGGIEQIQFDFVIYIDLKL
ncbi:MAG: DUF1570 domain-containing protein [Candidatus Cloacimonadales bacterium]|nr:DUF1570 domain-containing protein [Candidatus Cloacimonadales bacterium]